MVEDVSIHQPQLVLFGAATPKNFLEALSERMLIIEADKRTSGQEPRITEIPERLIQTAAASSGP